MIFFLINTFIHVNVCSFNGAWPHRNANSLRRLRGFATRTSRIKRTKRRWWESDGEPRRQPVFPHAEAPMKGSRILVCIVCAIVVRTGARHRERNGSECYWCCVTWCLMCTTFTNDSFSCYLQSSGTSLSLWMIEYPKADTDARGKAWDQLRFAQSSCKMTLRAKQWWYKWLQGTYNCTWPSTGNQ